MSKTVENIDNLLNTIKRLRVERNQLQSLAEKLSEACEETLQDLEQARDECDVLRQRVTDLEEELALESNTERDMA